MPQGKHVLFRVIACSGCPPSWGDLLWGFATSWWLRGPHQRTWTDAGLFEHGRQHHPGQPWNGAENCILFDCLLLSGQGDLRSSVKKPQTLSCVPSPGKPVGQRSVMAWVTMCAKRRLQKYCLWWPWLCPSFHPPWYFAHLFRVYTVQYEKHQPSVNS